MCREGPGEPVLRLRTLTKEKAAPGGAGVTKQREQRYKDRELGERMQPQVCCTTGVPDAKDRRGRAFFSDREGLLRQKEMQMGFGF